MVKNSSVDIADSLRGTGATSHDADAFAYAKSVTDTDSRNARHAVEANAHAISLADSAHAQHADARRVTDCVAPDEYAGDEHAQALGESVGKPVESNAGDEHGRLCRYERGSPARDEWR